MAQDPSEVVVSTAIEVLPASQLPTLREDLATMEKLRRDLEPISVEARTLCQKADWDVDARRRAGELTTEYKRIVKDAEATIAPHKAHINRFREDYILDPQRKVEAAATIIKGWLSPRMAVWDRAEQEKAQAEQKELRKEIGPDVTVKSQVPVVSGNVRRVNYSATCENHEKFLTRFLASAKQNPQLHKRMRTVIAAALRYSLDAQLSAQAREHIKTSPEDTNHDLTVGEFEKLYPFVKVRETRSY